MEDRAYSERFVFQIRFESSLFFFLLYIREEHPFFSRIDFKGFKIALDLCAALKGIIEGEMALLFDSISTILSL